MGRKTMNKQLSEGQKQKKLNENYSEWTAEDFKHSVNHAYELFILYQMGKGSSKATIENYEGTYKKLKKITNDGELPVQVVNQFGFQALFIESLGEVSPQTVNHHLRDFRAMGNYWESIGLIAGFKCPIKEVAPPIKDVYTDAEIRKLTVKPKTLRFEEFRNYCIVLLFIATGARANTVINLRVSDVDFENRMINFNTMKTHKVIQLPLDKKCVVAFKEYIETFQLSKNDWLFPNRFGDGQMTRNGLYQAIEGYNKRRGVEKCGLHLFRHYFAKTWIIRGGDLLTLAQVLTHSELEMVKRYANIYPADLANKMDQFSAISALKTHTGKTLNSRR